LAKFERTNLILVEYIKIEQYLNVSQKNIRINGTVWFWICVVKMWIFCSRCDCKKNVEICSRCENKIDTLDSTYRGMV